MEKNLKEIKLFRFNSDSIFSNNNYLKLWGAQLFSQTAVHVLYFITILNVYSLTQRSHMVSILLVSYGASAFVFSLFAGIFVDHKPKKQVLFYSLILRFFLVCFFIFFGNEVWISVILVFLLNAVTQFFFPAEGASIPLIVDKNNLVTANSLYLGSFYATQFLGYTVGGVLLENYGFKGTIVLISLLFLAAAGFISSTKFPKEEMEEKIVLKQIYKKIKAEVLKGYDYIRTNQNIKESLLYISMSQITTSMFIVLLPAYGTGVLNLKTDETSVYLVAPLSVGIASGALLISNLSKKISMERLVNTGILLAIAGLFSLSTIKRIPIESVKEVTSNLAYIQSYMPDSINKHLGVDILFFAIIFMIVIGFANSLILILNNTNLQTHTDAKMRGRVYGVLQTITILFTSVPVILIGVLADNIGVNKMLMIVSGFVLISHSFIRLKYKKSIL